MSLSALSSSHLQELVHLLAEKSAIQAQLAKVDAALNALDAGEGTVSRVPGKRRQKRRRRGGLKEAILEQLRAAGKPGVAVKEIAASIGANTASVAVWFYTTGKKMKEIKKVGRGQFSFRAP